MHAIAISSFGDPEVLEVVEKPVPRLRPGCVRVKVAAAAINPTDLMLRSGVVAAYLSEVEPPYVPGMDASGTVEEVAENVTDLTVGQRVVAFVNPFTETGGAQAERVVVPRDQVAPIPSSLPTVESAGLPMNGLTADMALRLLDLPHGATLAVTGGPGALGGFTIQLAKYQGLYVVADAKNAEDHELLLELGADEIVERGATPRETTRNYTASFPAGVDAVVDGAVLGEEVLPLVRDGGQLVECRPVDIAEERGIVVHHIMVMNHPDKRTTLAELTQLAAERVLTPRVAEMIKPEDAVEAHHKLAAGGLRGRQLVVF
ncbi:hypothetical protein CDG81_21440 [Actinopolyspora erythraea]|uniref:Enoyl reductase (ER) domain-containing protein n=1 Tax=Actinopolyspora erythraea TaxID=414996 RepID=A0A099DA12_9ACTN|nr:NADP-dependent oxidoreductase [Actinopolyspora erythraea]ASU80405.1 hypothetical protein CDG81_21440 [Actinopolyspora erythraea]KGI82919.1 hypothetical protein IL38_03445 [Actinopolyspora erythraea]